MSKNKNNKVGELVSILAIFVTMLGISASPHPFLLVLSYTVHELGHIALARLVKAKFEKIGAGVFKLALKYDPTGLSYIKEALITVGGILFNLLFALIVFLIFDNENEYASFLIICNLSLAVANLYPVSILDGGRLLNLTLLAVFKENTAKKLTSILSFVFVLILWLFSVYIQLILGANISTLIISVFLLVKLCFSL